MSIKAELNKLINHPAYAFLEMEAQHFDYTIGRQIKNPCNFYMISKISYKTDHFYGTAEGFLEDCLLPDFDRLSIERITQKKMRGIGNAKTFHDQFRKNCYDALGDLRPDDYYGDEDIPIYEESDKMSLLWSAYEMLENFAISLDAIRYIQTHCDLDFTFKFYLGDNEAPLKFQANNGESLRKCFITLSLLYFSELIRENHLSSARKVVSQSIGKYLTMTSGIATVFDFSSHNVFCLMGDAAEFSFKVYDFSAYRELIKMVEDINHFRYQKNLLPTTANSPHIRTLDDNIITTSDKSMHTFLFDTFEKFKTSLS